MKKMKFIIVLLLSSFSSLYSQDVKDGVKLYWENGNIKYSEYKSTKKVKEPSGSESTFVIKKEEFYTKTGQLVSKDDFVKEFGPSEIDRIYEQVEQKRNNGTSSSNDYQSLIKLADTQFYEKKYKEAIDSYNKALKIKPNEEYPKIQIKELNKLLEKQ